MKRANKMWQKPEITVLVRSNPEEVVLTFCKTNQDNANPGGGAGNCNSRGCAANQAS